MIGTSVIKRVNLLGLLLKIFVLAKTLLNKYRKSYKQK